MLPHSVRRIAIALLFVLAACGDDSSPIDGSIDVGFLDSSIEDDAAIGDASRDTAMDVPDVPSDAAPDVPEDGASDSAVPDLPASWPRGRGWDWVRENEPFISALSARMGPPPSTSVDRYFDDFHANAVHLWQTGIPTAINGWRSHRPGLRWLSWVDRDGNSSENGLFLGGEGRPRDGLIAYQIGDEPGDREHFEDILDAAGRIRSADPGPLRILNFTYLAEEIETFLDEACASGDIDIISYDRYSLGNSTFETMALFRDAAIECGVPYWRYMRGYTPNDAPTQTESDLRWDAFSGLLFGYTGHSWFIYNVRGGATEGIPTTFFENTETWGATTTPRFEMAAQINEELAIYGAVQTQLRSTGVAMVAGREIPGVYPPEGLPAWREASGGDPYLNRVEASSSALFQDVIFGFFEDRFGDTYVMVMNPNHENASFPNESNHAAQVTLGFDFRDSGIDGLLVMRPSGSVDRVEATSGSIEFEIAAGDIVFYKYDTGRPF